MLVTYSRFRHGLWDLHRPSGSHLSNGFLSRDHNVPSCSLKAGWLIPASRSMEEKEEEVKKDEEEEEEEDEKEEEKKED